MLDQELVSEADLEVRQGREVSTNQDWEHQRQRAPCNPIGQIRPPSTANNWPELKNHSRPSHDGGNDKFYHLVQFLPERFSCLFASTDLSLLKMLRLQKHQDI